MCRRRWPRPWTSWKHAYQRLQADAAFQAELKGLLPTYVGRPTPLSFAARLSASLGGAQIYLKREDLAHTGAHKINNALGQALLARAMGKRRIIAETGAGQHGVATATVCALLGMDCVVYMGSVDMARQQPNVLRMRLLGAEVRPVESGSARSKTRSTKPSAIGSATWMRPITCSVRPWGRIPTRRMVRDFQSVIGDEARAQILAMAGRLPDACIACVGGGSNAIGLFQAFRDDPHVELIGVEAGGDGHRQRAACRPFWRSAPGPAGCAARHLYLRAAGRDDGQIADTHSISAGLDYAAVGPEHAYLRETGPRDLYLGHR